MSRPVGLHILASGLRLMTHLTSCDLPHESSVDSWVKFSLLEISLSVEGFYESTPRLVSPSTSRLWTRVHWAVPISTIFLDFLLAYEISLGKTNTGCYN